MRYVPPFGVSDPESPYVNGDPTIGRQGSIPPAAVFEHPQREIVNVIDKSRMVPSDADLLQLAKAVRSLRMNYAEDTSVHENTLQVSFDPPILTYTPGLTLHVRVRNTNTGPVRIQAGAGLVPVRRMSGLELAENELPSGSVPTLVFSNGIFQLSNFGGGGEPEEVHIQSVKIPYTVDDADWNVEPNTIRANFHPGLDMVTAGEVIAVKIGPGHTNRGPTQIRIDAQGLFNLAPNGGGMMLQGDLHEGDIVIFVFDGNNFCFAPNPEIDTAVTYSVGFNKEFMTLHDGMTAIRRKFISPNGYITFQLCTTAENNGQPFQGPLIINHQNGDRIKVRGVMSALGPPALGNFSMTGSSVSQRHNDAINNLLYVLRPRYLTEVRLPNSLPGRPNTGAGDVGLTNTGAGIPIFEDLLVTGHELPMGPGMQSWNQNGVEVALQLSLTCINVACWGCQCGFNSSGGLCALDCFSLWNSHCGFHVGSGVLWGGSCHALGNQNYGFGITHSQAWLYTSTALFNETNGIAGLNGSAIADWYCSAWGNGGVDKSAWAGSALTVVTWPGVSTWNTEAPIRNITGNLNSILSVLEFIPQWML